MSKSLNTLMIVSPLNSHHHQSRPISGSSDQWF